jgi:hypothetical protein
MNGLNWMEGDPNEVPLHRRKDHWYFEGSRSWSEGQRPIQTAKCHRTDNTIRWKSKYGGMSVSEIRRLKELESENQRLKKLVAEKEAWYS